MTIKLFDPIFTREMRYEAIDALQNDQWTNGESIQIFEKEFAKFTGAKYAIGVNSGTSALYISILVLQLLNHPEKAKYSIRNRILTTPYSFIATANSIILSNNNPHFVDIDDDFNILPNLEKKLKEEFWTKSFEDTIGIIPVAIHGHESNISEISKIAKENNMFQVTDACQFHAKNTGVIGDTMCYSFYPTKNMTVCQDGGMITTNNEEIDLLCRSIRDCGRSPNNRNSFPNFGFTMRMASVGAAIGIEQLKHLDTWNEIRKKNAELYLGLLKDHNRSIRLPIHHTENSVWHIFEIRTKDTLTRNMLFSYLRDNDIEAGIHYPMPIHLQSYYKSRFGYKEGNYPVSERIAETTISLPIHPNLTEENIEYICSKIEDFFKGENRNGI